MPSSHSVLGEANCVSKYLAPILGMCAEAEIRCWDIPYLDASPFDDCDPRTSTATPSSILNSDGSGCGDEEQSWPWAESQLRHADGTSHDGANRESSVPHVVSEPAEGQDCSDNLGLLPEQIVHRLYNSSLKCQGSRLACTLTFDDATGRSGTISGFIRRVRLLAKFHRAMQAFLVLFPGGNRPCLTPHRKELKAQYQPMPTCQEPLQPAGRRLVGHDFTFGPAPCINYPINSPSRPGSSSDTSMPTAPMTAGPFMHRVELVGAPPDDVQSNVQFWAPIPHASVHSTVLGSARRAKYVFFDTRDGMRYRKLKVSWGMPEIISDAIRASREGAVQAVHLLHPGFDDLPPIQLVLDSADLPPTWRTVPIDLRFLDAGFCTLHIPADASAYEAAFRVSQGCEDAPPRIAQNVARGHWLLVALHGQRTDPFLKDVLHPVPALVGRTFGYTPPSSSDAGSTLDSISSSNIAEDRNFEVFDPCREEVSCLRVAFHTPGHPAWTHTMSILASPADVAKHAAVHMLQRTSHPRWRTHFLLRQPVCLDVDLHCIVTPVTDSGLDRLVFLADLRRMFGPGLQHMFAIPIPTVPGTDPAADMCDATQAYLLHAGFTDPPRDFAITTVGQGGLLIPAQDGLLAAVEDTCDVVSQFPGLRQAIGFYEARSREALVLRGTFRAPAEAATTTTTTLTTPEAHTTHTTTMMRSWRQTNVLARVVIVCGPRTYAANTHDEQPAAH